MWKVKKYFVVSVLVILACSVYFFIKNPEPISAITPAGYKDLSQAENINMEDDSKGASVEIPGEYGFMFKLTDKVEYDGFGESNIVENIRGSNSNGYQFNPIDKDKYPERGVWIRNAGIYNGRSVDLKLVIDNMDFRAVEGQPGVYPNFNFIAVNPLDKYSQENKPVSQMNTWNDLYLMVGSTSSTLAGTSDKYHIGDTVDYHYEFYDSESKQQFVLSGAWNFNNINNLKATSIPFGNDFRRMYGLAGSAEADSKMDIGYKLDTPIPGYIEMYGGNNKVNKKSGRLTHLFEKNSYKMRMERRYGNASNTPPTNPDTNTGNMGILYMTESIARIAPARPIVFGERNSATHTDPKYRELRYSILQNIADNTKLNRDSSFVLETEVPSYYSIDTNSIKIFEYGTTEEFTDIFDIKKNPESDSKVIISAKDPSADLDSLNPNSKVFNAHVFDIRIVAKPNSTFKFDASTYNYTNDANSPDDNGFMSFEQGGIKTKMSYTYKNPSGEDKFKDTLEAKIIDGQTKAKVLYEGIPDADPKVNIKVPMGTNLTVAYPKPGESFLDNIRVDTENAIDQPVLVSYTSGKPLPDTSILGEQSLWLTLTTAKNVTKDIEVKITIVPTSAELRVKYKINGSDMVDKYPDYVDSTQMIGAPINLKNIKQVTDTLTAIKEAGYKQTNSPTEEFNLDASGNTIVYEFEGILFLSSSPSILDFGIEEASYKAIRVNEAKLDRALIIKDTRAVKQKWTLSAKLTQDFTLTETGGTKKVIPNILRYNDGSDKEKEFPLNEERPLLIDEHTTSNEYDVSKTWDSKGKGFKLDVPGDSVKKLGKYQARIEFTVNATP